MNKQSAETTQTDERVIRCAEHNTTFYASYPHTWSTAEVLQALAAHFHQRSHVHPPFETIDPVPASAPLHLPVATARTRRVA